MRGRIKMVDSGGVRGGLDEVNEPYMAHRVGGSKYLRAINRLRWHIASIGGCVEGCMGSGPVER